MFAKVFLDFPADPLSHVSPAKLALADCVLGEKRIRPVRARKGRKEGDLLKSARRRRLCKESTHASIKTRRKGGPETGGRLVGITRPLAAMSGTPASNAARRARFSLHSRFEYLTLMVQGLDLRFDISGDPSVCVSGPADRAPQKSDMPRTTHFLVLFQFRPVCFEFGADGLAFESLSFEPLSRGTFALLEPTELVRKRLVVVD